MASMKVLLNQARRHYLTKPPSHLRPSLFPSYPKSLSSDSNPNPNPSTQESPPIQPVSYTTKPIDQTNETPPPQDSTNSPTQAETQTTWTRAEIRYLKDAPSISPVSYPTRVAPLPEDRVAAASTGEGEGEEGGAKDNDNVEEMERERRKIESENRARRRVFRIVEEEEKVKVPFPTIIKVVKKKEKQLVLDLSEAIKLIKANAKRTFDETVEAHVRLDIGQSRTDLTVRGTVSLPHGASKAVRIAVFAEGADADEARAAGADIVGGDELIEEIKKAGKINFEKCFSTHQCMKSLYQISQILNGHGLMPELKKGTVTSDFSRAVKEAQKNHVKFKMDKSKIVHAGLGKVSLPEAELRENFGAFMNALLLAKPAGLKKTSKYAGYVNSVHICSTMGPGIPVSIQSLSKAVDLYNKMLLN